MTKRKEWTLFYCTAEIDQVLRECDDKRAEALKQKYLRSKGVRT